jgi:hypothetical protein
MERSCAPVFAVLALLILSSYSALFAVEGLQIPDLEESQSDGFKLSYAPRNSHSSVDISAWRIGDKWVYDTTFDVAGLIASANLSGSWVNKLTGDTNVEVVDIVFMDLNGSQTLAYQVKSEGDFSTGNNGANLNGFNGRVEMEYEAYDFIRVSDLASIYSNFTVDVDFFAFNFVRQEVGIVHISNTYYPPNEGYDFPMTMGDTWNNSYFSVTNITGESDYFDLDGYNTSEDGTTTYQITQQGTPSNGTETIQYTGCGSSFKVSAWNESGNSDGFRWYCPEARSYAWNSFLESSLGMQIDWLLKEYDPIDSQGSNIASSPGIRMTVLDVNPQFDRVRPNADLAVWANYSSNMGQTPATNKNLQLRWEVDSEIQSLTTRFNGSAWSTFNVGDSDDNSTTIEDVGSHGVIVWDPVAKFVGVSTVVLDPDVTAIDLVARTDNVVVERMRDGISVNVPPNSINTIPGDELKFTMLVQNRGTETSPATDVEVSSPDGSSSRVGVPSLTPMESLAFIANWTVPVSQAIGDISLTFEVDPDENITEDGNRSNNLAEITIFVGRVPLAIFTVLDGFLTHENATVNASMSYDPDGGDVTCDFHIDEDEDGLSDITRGEDDCILEWAWNDDGEYLVSFTIYDDEGDSVTANTTVTVLNRAPWLNLSAPANVTAESQITIDASDSGDLDSHNEPVSISWPDVVCNEGLTQPTCTFSPEVEGEMTVTAVARDEDDATTSATISFVVLNRPPQLGGIELWMNGSKVEGEWEVHEDETVQLIATGNDTLLDLDSLFYHWIVDADVNPDEMVTTHGPSSTTDAMWTTAGVHRIQVELFDDDGVSGGVENRSITVINVPPVVPAIDPPQPVFEDQDVTLSGGATDTASDADNLTLCWDLDPDTNSDENGSADDDCDIEGKLLVHNFAKKGNYTVVFHATDDDGDSSSTNVTITVVNKAPIASLTGADDLSDGLTLVEGEYYTFYGFLSEDTPSDSDELWMWWDNDCLDSDGDGQASGDIDVEDVNATFEFPTPSTCVITLHVEDTDGGQSTTNVTVTVEAMPITEALFGSISQPTTIVGILIVILSLLLVFILVRGRSPTSQFDDDKSWSSEPTPGLMTQSTGVGVYDPLDVAMGEISAQPLAALPPTGLPPTGLPLADQPLADQPLAGLATTIEPPLDADGAAPISTATPAPNAAPEPEPFAALAPAPSPDIQPAPVVTPESAGEPGQFPRPQPTQAELAAPPVPASGLPPGWSLEQWKFYGANWLVQQRAGTTSRPSTTDDSLELDDDFDF